MPDSELIEIGLGLSFVFVMFSLLVSAASEMIVALFKSRAVSLWYGIGMLLNDNDQARAKFFNHPLIRSLTSPKSWGTSITSNKRSEPSYIEARTFAVVLLDLLKEPYGILGAIEAELTRTIAELRTGNTSGLARASAMLGNFAAQLPATPLSTEVKQLLQGLQQQLTATSKSAAEISQSVSDVLQILPAYWLRALKENAATLSPGLKGTIQALAEGAAGSIEGFRQSIERWFDEGMDRISGWYKRWTQAVQLGLGLVLAVALNVDTINIVRVLDKNDDLRHALAARAEAYAKTESLDPRNVVGQESSGQFPVSLQSADAQTFELKAGLPSDLPSDMKSETPTVTVTPTEKLKSFEITCETAPKNSQDQQTLVIPCTINQPVPALTPGELEVTSQWTKKREEQEVTETRTASIPVVLVPDTESAFKQIETHLKETQLPFGWENIDNVKAYLFEYYGIHILGWFLTALAASLGAPFWFDLLKKVANLRASGPNPDEKKST